eukprot:TRINITY_DN753_c0_g1_i10.p1 TRINITY_DN753_c0_g1~~TRINITY_DN753_c0_g1_i10.p1  ORF type:complete len:113 (+),score=20.91 TRINITY_DN753_c0_g1_i10:147-485(+)
MSEYLLSSGSQHHFPAVCLNDPAFPSLLFQSDLTQRLSHPSSNLSSKMISEVAKWIEEKRLNANRKKSSRSLSLSLRRRSRSGWVVSAIHGNRPRPDEKEGSGHMLINRKCT